VPVSRCARVQCYLLPHSAARSYNMAAAAGSGALNPASLFHTSARVISVNDAVNSEFIDSVVHVVVHASSPLTVKV
jgi:hypothetical protein